MGYFRRIAVITISGFLVSNISAKLFNFEISQGLDLLFQIRGPQIPPDDVVIVAMDETSESALGVGQDLTRWRRFHADLIRQLQKQAVSFIVFDLQFIRPQSSEDQELAATMRAADNVLVVECVQKFRHGAEDFYGREECSDSNSRPAISREGDTNIQLPEQLVGMRKVSPTSTIAGAVLDSAPFYLINDASNSSVREVWTFSDGLAESPSLPTLVWFYYLQHSGAIPDQGQPLSAWLTQQRRACKVDGSVTSSQTSPELRINKLFCQGDSRYLNYYGPPRTLRMESYADVYEGKVEDLQGKVIFVGRANRQFSPGKSDFFPTPYSDSHTGKMAGVEIMATQFANLLEDSFIEIPAPGWIISSVFGLLVALLLFSFAGWPGIVLSLVFASAYAGSAVWLFARHHWWLPVAGPLLIQLPLSWLLSLAWSRYDLMCERGRILEFVSRVFPQWVGMLPAAPGQWTESANAGIAKSEKDVSGLCLATDIEDYTAIAAQHSPREMWTLLNTYYQVLGHPVVSHDGVIADVTGDAMMAVWFDAPATQQRRSACLAALEMATAVASFNLSSSQEPLATRIGLHEGDLTLGSLDAGSSSHYRAIGDTVNIASRIQGVNKYLGTRILASQSIAADLEGIVTRPVGTFRVIGRAEPLNLVEVVGVKISGDNPHNQMHALFADGLAAFQEGRWPEATRLFQAALALDADDGPSRFYLQKALHYSEMPPLAWDGIVVLDGK
ncbi:adenylate/guanylate cyclase domain-containing protein [Methylomonas sp. OY6]|uniref:Adenylate/guanylate cyclase domain-containing protein n=1 Tax=Methylomonas defluvii TaxID=3045149 RepID=A0ABU4UCB7_9GAMM|nr:adenylate/guanylate cyclase domain-containing protein [Methylomonas sp. OY6]MDX8126582.1 adenylate/guanylate cyclase domain-containing protein [Methylomonas sp. OY6]